MGVSAMMSFNEIEIDDVMLPQDQRNATNTVREFIKVETKATFTVGIINAPYSIRRRDNACYICKTCAKGNSLNIQTESKTYFQHTS